MSLQASPDLVWSIVRNNSSFLVRRDGTEFARESNNITNRNTFKFSGLAPKRSIGVNLSTENDRSKSTKEFDFRRKHRVVVTKRVPRKVGRKVKPENESTKFPLSVSMKRVAKTILSELPRYRPDLQNAALARAVRLVKAVKNIRTDEKAANVREEEQRARKANKQ